MISIEDESEWLDGLYKKFVFHANITENNTLSTVSSKVSLNSLEISSEQSSLTVSPDPSPVVVPTAAPARVTRRSSVARDKPATATGQDPSDFFKSLLKK